MQPLTPLLAAASCFYRWGLSRDRARKRRVSVSFEKPVISVGNLTVGGTGKTPLVLKLIDYFQTQGLRPAVLARGYRGVARGSGETLCDWGKNLSFPRVNDELAMMGARCPDVPFGVGPDRAVVGEQLARQFPVDVFLLDDGFQHWKLNRDVDVVCLDALDPWGGGHVLPWGRLREPVEGLARAHLIVLTRSDLIDDRRRADLEREIGVHAPGVPVVACNFVPRLVEWFGAAADPAVLRSRVLAVSGVGHPEAFERSLSRWSGTVIPCRYPDHHPYSDQDVDAIERTADGSPIVMTEKDFVKLKETRWATARPAAVFVVKIDAELTPENRWRETFQRVS